MRTAVPFLTILDVTVCKLLTLCHAFSRDPVSLLESLPCAATEAHNNGDRGAVVKSLSLLNLGVVGSVMYVFVALSGPWALLLSRFR